MTTATIDRQKVYPRPARPGMAWVWVYTVTVPGVSYPMTGEGLAWARETAKRHGATRVIVTWQNKRKG